MLNQTVLTGNLGQDPEVFFSSEGDPIANFSIALNHQKRKQVGLKLYVLSAWQRL